MNAVERVACKDATVVFKLYMDFVLVICIWKRCFASANCLSFTLEMYLHPLFFFCLDLCFGILQRNFAASTLVEEKLVRVGAG